MNTNQNEIFSHYVDTTAAGTDQLVCRDFAFDYYDGMNLIDDLIETKGLDNFSYTISKIEYLNEGR
jgi:hypothetical protein